MTRSQWSTLLFWLGAILVIVFATVLYQPAAAKTGSLLIWMNNRIYVMDIDSLILERVGPAAFDDVMVPSPGCSGQTDTPCWVTAEETIFMVDTSPRRSSGSAGNLPVGEGYEWLDQVAVSWSPDGKWLAYYVFDKAHSQAELRIYNVASGEVEKLATGVDPTIAPAWTGKCADGLNRSGCALAFKKNPFEAGGGEVVPGLVALDLVTGEQREWKISAEPIFELHWTPEDELLYSRPKRYFHHVADGAPAYSIPSASQLANMSPNADYSVYYQPFTLADCQAEDEAETCMHLGVWLTSKGNGADEPRLIYSTKLTKARHGGLNFVPVWSPFGNAFVFIQDGQLIYYDLPQQEATVWYKPLQGKLRSLPVFSPNEEAVAFVDNQGQGYSEYRLVVINPRLQPLEHIIKTENGFKVLAWLPN